MVIAPALHHPGSVTGIPMPVITTIYLLGDVSSTHDAIEEAARRTFPQALVSEASTLAELLSRPAGDGSELLVLLSASAGELTKATDARDVRGLPRWPIVVRGGPPSAHYVSVSADDWTAPILGQALSAAVALQHLTRENALLRGDLRTIARRLGHDLRSPLNCITTAGEAMKEPTDGPDAPRTIFANSINDSVDEVVGMVERVGFVLRATAAPVPLHRVSMEEVVWGALQRLEVRMSKARGKVIQPPAWPTVSGVAAWLDVIWFNLLSNSLQHGGPSPRIELGWENGSGEYRFWVRDSGRGVPADRRARLFYPFDRLNELNAPRGLGLPIVQRLLELQGGRYGYEADPAPGGTFWFTLPAA